MFHFFILCTSLLTMFTCGNAFNDEWQQFSNFIDRFERKYDSIDEFENRFQIFRTNLRNIVIHNSDHAQNFTMGINQFTDLTPEEFKNPQGDQYGLFSKRNEIMNSAFGR